MNKGSRCLASSVLAVFLIAVPISLTTSEAAFAKEQTHDYVVEVGDSIILEEDNENVVSWYSLDESVAIVSEDGVVTGVNVGRTTVYCDIVEQHEDTVFNKVGDIDLTALDQSCLFDWDISVDKQYNTCKTISYVVEVTETRRKHSVIFDLIGNGIKGVIGSANSDK